MAQVLKSYQEDVGNARIPARTFRNDAFFYRFDCAMNRPGFGLRLHGSLYQEFAISGVCVMAGSLAKPVPSWSGIADGEPTSR
jgi:hypothetical protein